MFCSTKAVELLNPKCHATLRLYTHVATRHYAKQSGNAMRKILGGGSKKKFKYSETPVLVNADAFSKGAYEGNKSGSSRRVTVLNKTFMKYITDLMATGEHASEIVGHGIEIHRVNVTPDYKLLKVYWIANGTAKDDNVEEVLSKNAGFLRHELSQLRVMGQVPKLEFVKDKHYGRIVELDNTLARADFGDDYTPAQPYIKLKTELELITRLDSNVKEQLKKLEINLDDDLTEEVIPPMPQNVLGLDHADILQRITKSIKKSKERPVSDNQCEITVKQSLPVEYGDPVTERIAFKEFLQKRQVDRSRAKQERKNYSPDHQYIQDEYNERRKSFLDNLDLPYNYNDDDYITDDETK